MARKSPGTLRPLTFLRVTGSLGLCESPGGPQSPGPLRPLTFLRVTGSLGLWESPGGLGVSRATEATKISQGHLAFRKILVARVSKATDISQSYWAFGKVLVAQVPEATDISHWVTGPSGNSQWPGKVPGH